MINQKAKELSQEERERFLILSHTSNFSKSDEEWEEYCKLREKLGLPQSTHRHSKQRALHDKVG